MARPGRGPKGAGARRTSTGRRWAPAFLQRVARADAAGAASISGRQIYILPTKYGLLLAIVLLVMLVGSLNYGSNLGLLYTFLLTGVGLITILHTWRNLLGLRIQGERAEPVFAGQEAVFDIRIDNPGRSPREGLEISAGARVTRVESVPQQSGASARVCVATGKRGVMPLGRITLATRFPLGLLRAWCYADLPLSCLVYPRPATTGEPPVEPDYAGEHQGDLGVGADDFVGLRNYRPGDPPKHIFWKGAARTDLLVTKQFGGDRSQRVWLDWASLSKMDDEARLSLLCRFVLLASERRQSYGLRLPTVEVPPGRDADHRQRCLRALALFPEAP